MGRDLRYALRALRRSPGFTMAAVLTLALGIGANSALFTLVDAVLLRPPAGVAAPERLVALYTSDFSGPPLGTSSYPDLQAFAAQNELFTGVAAYTLAPATIGEGAATQRVGAERVSADYFEVLGVRPAVGRFFSAAGTDVARAEPAVVVSHALWVSRLDADRAVVGRPLTVNGRPLTVVGVAPAGFVGSIRGVAADVWVTLETAPMVGLGSADLTQRGDRSLFALARLRPGVSIAAAQQRMSAVAAQLHAAYPTEWTDVQRAGRRVTVLSERAARVPAPVRTPVFAFLALLTAVAGLVLLICCANVAGLALARATARVREIGVRIALGAARARIVRQLLSESILLSLAGAGLGLVATVWAAELAVRIVPPLPVRLALDLAPDRRVLAFTAAVSVATALLFGLVPALRVSRADLVVALRADALGDAGAAGRRRVSLRDALIVGQLTISLVLLSGAVAFLRTLHSAAAIDPGFNAEHLLLATIEPPPNTEVDRASVGLALRDRVAALPGVRSVTWAEYVPLGFDISRRHATVAGYQPHEGEDMELPFNVVGPHYFATMRIPLSRGRDFTDADRSGAPGVAVVNETFARQFWPNADPLGRRLSFNGPDGPFLQVVGIARDGKYQSLAEAPRPYVYTAALQAPGGVVLHVRTTGAPLDLLPAVRREVGLAAPTWTVENPRTMDAQVAGSLLPQRAAAGLLGAFGAVALLLAAVGVYGVIAYAVARRTREIGVRVALGARRGDVLRLVMRRAATLTGAGIVLGVPLVWGAMRLLSTFLLGTPGGSALSFGAAAAALAAVALAASYVPARRAAGVDPTVAMRSE